MYEEAQQEMQLNNDHGESNLAYSDQSFEDICNEEIRRFEELELVINSKCLNSYLEPFIKECAPQSHPPELEPVVSKVEINMIHGMSKIHINENPMSHFKQAEWIFDNESVFCENKNSCSNHNEKMRWDNDTKDNSRACEDDSNNDVAELVKHEKENENDTGYVLMLRG